MPLLEEVSRCTFVPIFLMECREIVKAFYKSAGSEYSFMLMHVKTLLKCFIIGYRNELNPENFIQYSPAINQLSVLTVAIIEMCISYKAFLSCFVVQICKNEIHSFDTFISRVI